MFIKAGELSKLPPGSLTQVDFPGASYALCNVGGTLYAMDGTCPHAGGPLGEGALHEHVVVCPWHAWEYDCRTGQNDFDPGVKVVTYPVRVEGDTILIEVPDAGTA